MRRHSSLLVTSAVAATAAFSLLAAGCGGGPSGAASLGPSASTAQSARAAAAMDFARCMRSHGVSNWPDPDSTGGFDKSKLRQLGVSPARVRALGSGACNIPIPGPAQAEPVTPADRVNYLKAAACMRTHGFSDFPDPTFPKNSVALHIPSSIDQGSPSFKAAAETCTKLIPAGLPYSRPGHS